MLQNLVRYLPERGRFYIATAPGRVLNTLLLIWAYQVYGNDSLILVWVIGLAMDASLEFYLQRKITFTDPEQIKPLRFADYQQAVGGRFFAAGLTTLPAWFFAGQEINSLFLVLYLGSGIFSWTFHCANQYRINTGKLQGFFRFYFSEIYALKKPVLMALVWLNI